MKRLLQRFWTGAVTSRSASDCALVVGCAVVGGALTGCALSGCTATNPPPPNDSTVVTNIQQSAPAPAEASSSAPEVVDTSIPASWRALKLPAQVAPPKHTSCILKGQEVGRGLQLRSRPGGETIARLWTPPQLTMALNVGDSLRGAVVDAQGSQLHVRATMNGEDVKLYAAGPLVLAGYAIPTSSAILGWRHGKPGQIDVIVKPKRLPEVTLIRPPAGTLGCDAVQLKQANFSAPKAIPERRTEQSAEFVATTIQLLEQPGGERLATFAFSGKKTRRAVLYERRGGFARISYALDELVLFGWVDGKQVHAAALGLGGISSYSSGDGGGRGRNHWVDFNCDEEVPLMARDGDNWMTLGVISAGTKIRRWRSNTAGFDTTGTYLEAALPDVYWLREAGSHRFGVPQALVEKCPVAATTQK